VRPASGPGGWKGLRDRLLSSPAFQRRVARWPLLARIARRESRALFDLCAGFVYSQVLLACVELGLFDRLQPRPLTTDEVAAGTGLERSAAQRLLEAAASLRLVEHCGEQRWRLGPHGAVLQGSPGILAMVEHHRLFYEDLRDPVALLRGDARPTRLERFWSYARGGATAGDPEVEAYSRLMAASQSLVADDVLDAVSLRRCRMLLDVGGGEGGFVAAVARRHPQLGLMLLDLPSVAERARASLAAAGLGGRVAVHGGDFLREPLPSGADCVSLVRVVHDHDDAAVLALLAGVRAALPPGGTVLVAEPMSGQVGTEPMADAYFGFYLLAMGQGRARSPQSIVRLLGQAGFRDARPCRTARPLLVSVVTARA
jgi:demethylspheroidene O-methyltransferase